MRHYVGFSQIESQTYFSAENLLEVNPVMINYKIRYNKNQPARCSLAWLDHFSRYLWWQKNRKMQSGHVMLRARVAMEKGLLS